MNGTLRNKRAVVGELEVMTTGLTGADGLREDGEGRGGVTRERGLGKVLMEVAGVEAWPEAVAGEQLLDELVTVIKRFVVLPEWGAETVALWILHSYAFQLREVSTYLGIESPEKRCGKTTLLMLISELAHRPVLASNISPSAFFRVIEEMGPSLLIDEADTLLYGNDELRGILNAGYTRKAAFVVRVAQQARASDADSRKQEEEEKGQPGRHSRDVDEERQGRGSRLVKFSCWCPKVIAAIGRLPETLADRCIVIRMQRKTALEGCERLRELEGGELRRKCAKFVRENRESIRAARAEIPEGLNDRAGDIWEPLFVLADLSGGRWGQLARRAAVELAGRAEGSNPMGALLLDLFVVFTSRGADRMFSWELVESLKKFGERPWGDREVTERWLAQKLRPYGVRPRTLRIGESIGKGYELASLREVFRRYIPESEVEDLRAEFIQNAEGTARSQTGEGVGQSEGSSGIGLEATARSKSRLDPNG